MHSSRSILPDVSDQSDAGADARGWLAASRAWLSPRTRVLLPVALVTLLLSSEPLFQPGLFVFWSPADVLHAWLEYLAELVAIASLMVAAYWLVDAAIKRWPRGRRWRLLWMAAAFHAVVFGALWGMTVVSSDGTQLTPTGLALTQAMRYAFSGTILVVLDALWQKAQRADSETAALTSGGAALAREERELQLRLLQAQIEPHFLFNTLANVRRLYRLHPDQGTQMMDSLKRYLRPRSRACAASTGRSATSSHSCVPISSFCECAWAIASSIRSSSERASTPSRFRR